MSDRDLNALFMHTLKDTYYAENAILKALDKNVGLAQSPALKEAFEAHRGETTSQIERLEQIFGLLGTRAEGVECKAILGILAEGDEVAAEFSGGPAADAGLVASAQAVEHYDHPLRHPPRLVPAARHDRGWGTPEDESGGRGKHRRTAF